MGGGLISQKGNANGHNKGRPYGLILLLVFGAALFGVMMLHKLRERRIFNLLIEDKNRQLLSLQQLLRKEREHNKEMGRKAEETKAKIYYLRNQKLKLDRRLFETLSTIDSLKDEQKITESALVEKQNQIKLLRDKDMNENPQIIALTATLKQKEAEIEDLKHRLITSRQSTDDDSSNPGVNMTVMESMERKGGDNSSKGQDGNETKSTFTVGEDKREGFEDGLQRLSDLGENDKNENSEDTGFYGIDVEKNHANSINTIDDVDDEQDKRSSFNGELGKRKDLHQASENQKLQRVQGGMKLEIDGNSKLSRLTGRLGQLSRTKGKRWRGLAMDRFLKRKVNSGIDVLENMTSRRLSKEYKDAVRSREDGGEIDETETETHPRSENEMDERKANLLKNHNSKETIDRNHRKVSAETSYQVEGQNAKQRNHGEDTGVNGEASNYTQDTNNVKVEEAAKTKQNMNNMDVKELQKRTKVNSAHGIETEDDNEFAYEQETETKADKGDIFSDLDDK